MLMPAGSTTANAPELPVLSRLNAGKFEHVSAANNAELADVQLQDDLGKLGRSGFVLGPQAVPMTCWT